ncbi:hypothetical protein GJ496_004029 [Pomphorhynchus laevis]|nr:hypothetical protein GJ496_004029 [Pomphorhynchus laevis]
MLPGTTHTHVTQTQPSEKDVKVIVQPIQPVFYLPRNPSTPAPAPTYPVAPNPPPPAAPTVVYVPRNVYVPVIKPVFVPRERVIVRPQIVQVARPVVIDRPIPVTQRPIVIDRERPVPFPVSSSLPVGQVSNEQYIYRDNLPLAYGGRTGEFATGMNYGYMPVNEDYQYIVSESDDFLRQQLVNSHLQHNQQYQLHTNSGYYGSQGDCFDQALEEATSGRSVDFYSKRNEHKSIPNQARVASSSNVAHYTNINVADENRNALVETLRRAGTGCVNLEVLDPTVRPVWEPINAKMLIQRYGQSAIRFVESGSSYGYNSFIPYSNNNSNISLGDNVSQSKFQDINISTEYIPTPVSGSYGHGSSIHNYENRSLMNGSGFSPADFGNYNSSNINSYGYHSEGSFDDMELSKYKSTSSLQMGGGIDKWPASNLYNRHEELAAHTSVM